MKRIKTLVRETDLRHVSLFLIVIGFWIYTHPYNGIYHDARLYAVQALSHIYPDAYKNDLFFKYGSQDNFTIFSYIYAYFIKLIGLNKASILLLVVGQALWFSAAYLLGKTLLRGTALWLYLIFICALSPNYATNIFRYGEPFLSPRLFSEATILFSINLMIMGRTIPSILLTFLAFLFHPLMAAGGFVFLFLYKFNFSRKYFLISGLTLTFIFIASILKIEPFTAFLQSMDETWYRIISSRNYFTLIEAWNGYYFSCIIFNSSIICSTAIVTSGIERRVILSALGTGLLCLLISWVGGHIFKNVFIIQIQPYRALWIMHLFSYLAASILFFKMWINAGLDRLIILAYIIAWFTLIYTPLGGVISISIFSIHLFLSKVSFNNNLIPRTSEVFISFLTFALGVLWLLVYWQVSYLEFMKSHQDKTLYNFTQKYLIETGIILVMAFFLFKYLISKCNKRPTLLMLLFLVFSANMALALKWDRRTEWEKFIEMDHSTDLIPFSTKVPEGSVISWPNYFREDAPIKAVWFLMKRSSYADILQGSGLLFSKQTALKYDQRVKNLESLDFFENKFWPRDFTEELNILPSPDISDLNYVCQDPELDYLVHYLKFQNGLVDIYFNEFFKRKYYLYNCNKLRKNCNSEGTESILDRDHKVETAI